MATKRPAKLASAKKAVFIRLDPVTGKQMTAVKVMRREGSRGMHWVVLEDFQGKPEQLSRMIPIR